MLKHAGSRARELFQESLRDPPAPIPEIEKAERIEVVRRRREEHDQDVSFGARPFILCGLPSRRLPTEALKYTRRNGRFFLEIVGHADYGVPFGQDRLALLWLATATVRTRSPVVRFGSAGEILVEWGMSTNGSHYRRLQEAFCRVFASTIFFGTHHFLDHTCTSGFETTERRIAGRKTSSLCPRRSGRNCRRIRSLLILRSRGRWRIVRAASISTLGSFGVLSGQ